MNPPNSLIKNKCIKKIAPNQMILIIIYMNFFYASLVSKFFQGAWDLSQP